MFWKKKELSQEELLADAEKRRDEANDRLDKIKDRLEIEVDIAKIKVETELEQKRLQNPKAEYERRKSLEKEDKLKKK